MTIEFPLTIDRDIKLLHVDNHLLVVVKPPRLPVQADRTGDADLLTILKNWLARQYAKPGRVFLGLVQRLDRPTGGVMVLARTSKSAARLAEQIRLRKFAKTYLAILEGRPRPEAGPLTHHLRKDRTGNQVSVVKTETRDSREARLCYQTIQSRQENSLVKIELQTGRTHQIRVQMNQIGCPILGDRKYNRRLSNRESPANNQQPSGTMALWSYQLKLVHPTRRHPMQFTAPPPWQLYPWSVFTRIMTDHGG